MFQFMDGKIDIDIPKTGYTPGEKLHGTVRMTIKKAINARGVNVALVATRVEGSGKHKHTVTLYNDIHQLDNEKTYRLQSYEYKFEFDVPDLKIREMNYQGFFGGILNALTRQNPVRWRIRANLDIPLGIDVTKELNISVVKSPEQITASPTQVY